MLSLPVSAIISCVQELLHLKYNIYKEETQKKFNPRVISFLNYFKLPLKRCISGHSKSGTQTLGIFSKDKSTYCGRILSGNLFLTTLCHSKLNYSMTAGKSYVFLLQKNHRKMLPVGKLKEKSYKSNSNRSCEFDLSFLTPPPPKTGKTHTIFVVKFDKTTY